MFLRNSWYVAAWAHELGDRPLARTILGEPIVLFRTASGAVGALRDRCPHRHLPLSMGKIVGEDIECGYHGMQFGVGGRCRAIPSQSLVPPSARVRAYPLREKYGWVWIWMGEADTADEDLIPDFGKLTDPAFAAVGKTNHVRASYRLLIDNLLDLSHVGFVHTSTIGNAEFGQKGSLTSRRTGRGVEVVRLVPDVPPPPTYVKSGVLPPGRNIDRWQHIDYLAPSFVQIHVGGAEAGTGALEGRTGHGLNIWVLNAITPETENSSLYFWASVRQHAIGDEAVDALFLGQVSEAFAEDQQVLEAQQVVLDSEGDSWSLALRQDQGSIEARRVLDKLIADEAGPENTP
jgi:phenylpropionate dioxygenase-like ring-hydroxylating dioxygenase large terminal subunit